MQDSGLTRRMVALLIAGAAAAAPVLAAEESVTLARCQKSFGSIAVVDGDTQGWTAYGLASPRELIAAMAVESGCFTIQDPASGQPATYLMNVVAGDKEEIDKSVDMAKTLVTEGLVRSGAAAQVFGRVPMGGALMGAFGGFGGKKKTVAAGIKIINPSTGMTMVAGQGTVTKTAYSFAGIGAGVTQSANGAAYAGSKDGRALAAAFIIAYNSVIAQGAALNRAITTAATASTGGGGATTAVDTKMFATASRTGTVVRSVRSGTTLKPTGQRQGIFVEVADDFGSKGWVSVEDLK
ncbi:MAG: SH3 domain-containing protein [Polymorphobacter sp.]